MRTLAYLRPAGLRWMLRALCVLASLLAQAGVQAAGILFLAAAPTQTAKFERMREIAAQEGLAIEARFVEGFSGQEKASDFAAFELIVIDAPYGAAL